jgi:hypothetical protein
MQFRMTFRHIDLATSDKASAEIEKQHAISTLSDAAIRFRALKHQIAHNEKIEKKEVQMAC